MDLDEHVQLLFAKYLRKDCTDKEFEELVTWLVTLDNDKKNALSAPLRELWDQAKAGKLESSADQVNWDHIYDRVIHLADQPPSISLDETLPRRIVWRKIAVAVIIFGVILSASIYYATRKPPAEIVKTVVEPLRSPKDINPGKNNAVLKLSNGAIIILDSAKKGVIAVQGDEKLILLDSGKLSYTHAVIPGSEPEGISFNTISTPRAAQYQLVLSDGTKVWLNAASSLRYPTAFTGKDRSVELTGEGYFEVTKNKEKPFVVHTNDMEITVLGTHFNIMAYEDENDIQTTLLEGIVNVHHDKQTDLLKPGKQAILRRDNNKMIVSDANINQAVAWKNGYFYFDKSDINEIMRQVSRWYDLDIVYEAQLPDMKFSGKIERRIPLSGITHLLASSQIHFRIEGKKFIIMK
ncbi:MAG TPA: FecR family protein [Puia sp.]|nr:FecR family protein [Puia sp.]